jgi:NADPH-dependent 2,4-dienoyl-CoA reductase/sulfur reductase-like enzyme
MLLSSKCYHHRGVKTAIASRAFAGVNPKDLALFQIPPTMQQAPLSNSMLPKINSMLSSWRAQPHHLDAERTTEELPNECDVLIIGAGYAGVSTAYHL